MNKIVLLAATVGLAVPAVPAIAQETAVIEFADLNLDSREGQKLLDLRIRRAIDQVCAVNETPTGTRIRFRESRDCKLQAYASVKQQVAAKIENKKLGG